MINGVIINGVEFLVDVDVFCFVMLKLQDMSFFGVIIMLMIIVFFGMVMFVSIVVFQIQISFDNVNQVFVNLGFDVKKLEVYFGFVGKFMDSLIKGIGDFVDVDFVVESVKLQVLQVK